MANAHVPSVIIKSISISTMLLEYSRGKLKYDSTNLCLRPYLPLNYLFLLKVFLRVDFPVSYTH